MEVTELNDCLFVRLEPEEAIIQQLKEVARIRSVRTGAITSGVGMLKNIELGFFQIKSDSYERHRMSGIFDLSSIQGNITWNGDQPVPHVHMTFNDAKMRTFSGHVIEGHCHITMEIFVQRLDSMNLHRIKVPGVPATRITREPTG